MMTILFLAREGGRVNYGISPVRLVRYITPSEIGFTDASGRERSCAFPHSEVIQVEHER
jgi:hypothetical protein